MKRRIPVRPRIPRNPHAVMGEDGRFVVTTFKDGDGAAEGGYQISLKWPPDKTQADSQEEGASETDRLLGGFDGTHSTLNIRVKEGSNTVPTIPIGRITQAPPESKGVPGRN